MEKVIKWESLPASISEKEACILELPLSLYCFYTESTPGEDGFPRNGSLWEEGSHEGKGTTSFFDVTASPEAEALLLTPEEKEMSWVLTRKNEKLILSLSPGKWDFQLYKGNEPNWNTHSFPFHDLPKRDPETSHAHIRGLLDFLAGTRRSPVTGVYFQSPNTSIGKGYSGDGIPDTFFQFIAVYPFLDEERKKFYRSQIDFLGSHMRFDSCIPWGGCRLDDPYYHLWKRSDCGQFFDANGMWLEMTRLLYKFDKILPDPEKVIRAADFYLHNMTLEGLVAADAKKRGCEWADFLQNGWHSSLINVLAYQGLKAASELMDVLELPELSLHYRESAARLKKAFNKDVKEGGFWQKNGFIDWRDQDGTLHDYWRIDTHFLASLWNVAEEDKKEIIFRHFKEEYFKDEPAVPAPYILNGSWFTEERDDMLEGTRTYGCGKAAMPGRMAGPLMAALRKNGDEKTAEHIRQKLLQLLLKEKALWEYYDHDGTGHGARSYIEHSLVLLYAHNLAELYIQKQ